MNKLNLLSNIFGKRFKKVNEDIVEIALYGKMKLINRFYDITIISYKCKLYFIVDGEVYE